MKKKEREREELTEKSSLGNTAKRKFVTRMQAKGRLVVGDLW